MIILLFVLISFTFLLYLKDASKCIKIYVSTCIVFLQIKPSFMIFFFIFVFAIAKNTSKSTSSKIEPIVLLKDFSKKEVKTIWN